MMERLRELAAEDSLIAELKEYREPKLTAEALDSDTRSTTVVMSDGAQRTVPFMGGKGYYGFFVSVAEDYAESDTSQPCGG